MRARRPRLPLRTTRRRGTPSTVLPAEVVRTRPQLLLAQALMAATSGHLEVVEPLLDALECAPRLGR